MAKLMIQEGKVCRFEDRFTEARFAEAVGVSRATVNYWVHKGKINLDQKPYEVILQFWRMRTECTRCGKRTQPGIGIERWCPHCGEPRLKIGITYYVDRAAGDDGADGVTSSSAFETSSKAMCRARERKDRIRYLS